MLGDEAKVEKKPRASPKIQESSLLWMIGTVPSFSTVSSSRLADRSIKFARCVANLHGG